MRYDLIGQNFGQLVIIAPYDRGTTKRTYFTAECSCGEYCVVRKDSVKKGHNVSCGCKKVHHGEARRLNGIGGKLHSPTFQTWRGMINRCYTLSNTRYPYYGGMGITVCDMWKGYYGFSNFLRDMGARPENMTLDRIDPFGNYEPTNCRWADKFVQANNKRYVKMVQVGNKLVHPLIARGLVKAL